MNFTTTTDTPMEPERPRPGRPIERADIAAFDADMEAIPDDDRPSPKEFLASAEISIENQFRKGIRRDQIRTQLSSSQTLKAIDLKIPEATLIRIERRVRKEVRDARAQTEMTRSQDEGGSDTKPPRPKRKKAKSKTSVRSKADRHGEKNSAEPSKATSLPSTALTIDTAAGALEQADQAWDQPPVPTETPAVDEQNRTQA